MSPEARGWSQQSKIANRLNRLSRPPGDGRRTYHWIRRHVAPCDETGICGEPCALRRDRNRDLRLTCEGDGDDPELPCGRRERAPLAKRAAKSARHGRTFAVGTCSGFESKQARQHHQTGVREEPAFRPEQHAYPDGQTNKALEVLALGQTRQSSGLKRSQVFRHRHSATRAQTASTNPNGHAPCKKP